MKENKRGWGMSDGRWELPVTEVTETSPKGGREQRCVGGEGTVGAYVEVAAFQAGEHDKGKTPRCGIKLQQASGSFQGVT